jgi:hypothetical protein
MALKPDIMVCIQRTYKPPSPRAQFSRTVPQVLRKFGNMTHRSIPSQSQGHRIFFFGSEFPKDDLRDLFRRMVVHAKDRRFRLLAAFIEECTRVLKGELALLPRFVSDGVSPFESILHLSEQGNFGVGCLGAAMENALLVVLQVGMFIG